MRHTARAMCAETLAIRARLAVHWKSFAEYFGAPEIRSLAFFDPAFIADSDRGTVLGAAVDAAVVLSGADMGNVQVWNSRGGVLAIEAQRGFAPPFLQFFEGVRHGEAACGLAFAQAGRVVVEDVAESLIFRDTPGRDVLREAGARAVQSMSLFGASGRPLGVLSTHWGHRRRPSDREVQLLALVERLTGRYLECNDGQDAG